MELRRIEEDLKSLCKSWKELRGARKVSDDDFTAAVPMPTLKELFLRINDDVIFPPVEVEPEDMEFTDADKNNSEETISMAPSKPILSASESAALSSVFYSSEEDEEDMTDEEINPQLMLEKLETLHESISLLAPKMNKFLVILVEKDPVSGKPRYGVKTIIRVKNVIRTHKALELGMSYVFQDDTNSDDTNQSTLVSYLRKQVQRHEDQMNEKRNALQAQEQLELERIANEKLLAQKHEMEQRLLDEQLKREQETELSRRAEESRRIRIEEEQLALAAEREVDANLLNLVPTRGPEGVREQIEKMRQSLKEDRAAFDIALGSLYTLFDQIIRKPEEVNFRRVRRDHPKFNEDIGRHVGGKEVLIASGFRLETLDGVKCFFSREPDIENDMNGWSDWFDVLKKTLEIIEEEMIK